jgi:hypothetical protein
MLIYVCCVLYVFLRFNKHWLCRKYQYNIYMFNFIYIYSFIPMSGCVGMGPSAQRFTDHAGRDVMIIHYTVWVWSWWGKRWCMCVLHKHLLYMHALQNSRKTWKRKIVKAFGFAVSKEKIKMTCDLPKCLLWQN